MVSTVYGICQVGLVEANPVMAHGSDCTSQAAITVGVKALLVGGAWLLDRRARIHLGCKEGLDVETCQVEQYERQRRLIWRYIGYVGFGAAGWNTYQIINEN